MLVSAASSLIDVFTEMESVFEAAHPDIDVRLNFAGSSLLATQIVAGAPADVYAPADTSHMDRLADIGLTDGPTLVFARNTLEIATPTGNPGQVSGLADFANDDLFIGLCDEPVPCGRLARQVLDNANVIATIDTSEPNVRSLLTKIAAAELDAGIVYVSDVLAADGEVDGIVLPEDVNEEAHYPIATVAEGPNPTGARQFIAFVLSEEGQGILSDHGFLTP